jgi:hypothetical protein
LAPEAVFFSHNKGLIIFAKQEVARPCSGAGRRWFAVQSAEGAAAAAAHAALVERAVVVVGGAPTASSETAGARRVADVAAPLAAGTDVLVLVLSLRIHSAKKCDTELGDLTEWPVSFRECHTYAVSSLSWDYIWHFASKRVPTESTVRVPFFQPPVL